MPRSVALISVASGLAVASFGALFTFIAPEDRVTTAAPSLSLDPVDDDRGPISETGARGQASGVRGQGSGVRGRGSGVRGKVVSSSGEAIANTDIELVPLFIGKKAKRLHASTDSDGAFAFKDVEINPGSPYSVDIRFGGARFSSEILRSPRGRDDPVEVVVAKTTRKIDSLSVEVESLALVGDATGAQAVHAFTVVNGGARAYVGALRLPFLKGAIAIREGAGLDRRYLDIADATLVSKAPVLPGRHNLTYTYVVQMTKNGIALDRRPTLPTKRYELLVGGNLHVDPHLGRPTLRDDGEVKLGPREDKKAYRRFVARDLDADSIVSVRLTAGNGSDLLRTAATIAGAAAGAIVLAFVLMPLVRRRRGKAASPPDPAPQPTPSVR